MNDVVALDKFDANGVSIFSFKKLDFSDYSHYITLKKESLGMQEFFQLMREFSRL